MAYQSKYTGVEVDALLDKIAEDNVGDIDTSLSTTSQNPVTNAAITAEIRRQDSAIEEMASANETFKTEVSESMKSFKVEVGMELEKKANQDGKYPQLTSGFANNLVGRGESTESEFTFRASGGKSIEDGAARISELRGNGVVWNQGIRNSDFSQGKDGWGIVGGDAKGTFEIEGDAAVITITSDPQSESWGYLSNSRSIIGHKYLCMGEVFIPKATNVVLTVGPSTEMPVEANKWVFVSGILTANTQWGMAIYPKAISGGYVAGDVWKTRRHQFIDLTLMFSEGNEPTTIEEFYARKPIGVDEYAYNEGTLIPFNADAIKSVGFNAWDEQWESGDYNGTTGEKVPDGTVIRSKNLIKVLPNTQYYISVPTSYGDTPVRQRFYTEAGEYIGYEGQSAKSGIFTTPSNCGYVGLTIYSTTYNNDVCIHLVHTGYRNGEYQPYMEFARNIDPRIKEAFPNGMKPCDKVYNKNGKGYIVKGSGSVDLGSLNYMYQAPIAGTYPLGYFNTMIDGKAIGNSNLLCGKYSTIADWTSIGVRGSESSAYVYIKDSAYTDAAAFKAAMAGVPLWYELAEPEVIEYDEPFNLDYIVWDFGTEEILSEQPSAPISADIIYQFNAVDTIRNNQIEIAQLKAMIATMQAQMASLTSQTNLE